MLGRLEREAEDFRAIGQPRPRQLRLVRLQQPPQIARRPRAGEPHFLQRVRKGVREPRLLRDRLEPAQRAGLAELVDDARAERLDAERRQRREPARRQRLRGDHRRQPPEREPLPAERRRDMLRRLSRQVGHGLLRGADHQRATTRSQPVPRVREPRLSARRCEKLLHDAEPTTGV